MPPPVDHQAQRPARAQLVLQRLAQPFISRPPSAHAIREERVRGEEREREKERERERSQSRTRSTNKSRSFAAKTQISSLDISPDKQRAIIAGKDIFKIVSVKHNAIVEEYDLRRAMSTYATIQQRTTVPRSKDVLAIGDVKWSHGLCDNVVATAPSNGKIVLYDLSHPGLEITRLHEHQRSVHKLAFNPHDGRLLLSGSQDGTVKLWDLREYAGGHGIDKMSRSLKTIQGRSEAVRDVKWSPRDGMEFAFVTDNGSLQRWDIRKDNQFLMKVAAHDGPCFTLDYHPDGWHIASAGRDKCIKGWQLEVKSRRHKPSWDIRTPQGVNHLAWRPASTTPRGTPEFTGPMPGTTQIATSYNVYDGRIQVWDFNRKYVPVHEFDAHGGNTTGMLWVDEDTLWSVGKDGIFLQTDVTYAPKPQERRSYQAMDISTRGEIGYFVAPTSRTVSSLFDETSFDVEHVSKSRTDSSGEKLSGTRLEDEKEDGFLSSSTRRWQRTPSSSKPSKSAAPAPVIANGEPQVWNLKEHLESLPNFKTPQFGGRQAVRPNWDAEAYSYLAQNYVVSVESELAPAMQLDQRFYAALDWNARLAQAVGKYRAATIWAILQEALEQELSPQVQLWRKQQLERASQKPQKETDNLRSTVLENSILLKKTLMHETGIVSTSNMTTPLARPVPDSPRAAQTAIRTNTLVYNDIDDIPRLPPPLSKPEPVLSDRIVADPYPDFYGESLVTDESRQASTQKPELKLQTENTRPNAKRDDSDDSFHIFSASTDDWQGTSVQGSYGSTKLESDISSPLSYRRGSIASGKRDRADSAGLAKVQPDSQQSKETASTDESSLPYFTAAGVASAMLKPKANMSPALGAIRVPNHMKESGTLHPPTPQMDDYAAVDRSISETMPDEAFELPLKPATSPIEPWHLQSLLFQALGHAIQTGDLQLASNMALLFSTAVIIPTEVADLTDLLPAYWNQLSRRQLHVPAARVALLSYDTLYPHQIGSDIDSYLTLSCGRCGKPLENINSKRDAWWCEHCSYLQDPCSICWERSATKERWSWCLVCAHGGHDRCLTRWFDDSNGQCPGEGCDCICVESPDPRHGPGSRQAVKAGLANANDLAASLSAGGAGGGKSRNSSFTSTSVGTSSAGKDKGGLTMSMDRDRKVKLQTGPTRAVDIVGSAERRRSLMR